MHSPQNFDHRQTMTAYYRIHSPFYDATRWAFLYGRRRLVEKLEIVPGERIIEIGCGTGANFAAIQSGLGDTGELIGIDCSAPMLRKAAERVRKHGWTNVRLLDLGVWKGNHNAGQGRRRLVFVLSLDDCRLGIGTGLRTLGTLARRPYRRS
jgi:tRNA G46 methylase TrmB